MAKKRGLRSSNDAKPWKCRCGKVNHPKKYRFFDVPRWQCRGCKREFKGSFKCCLGEIEVDGGSVIGEVWDQEDKPFCVAYAYGKGINVAERVACVKNGTDPDEVEPIDPDELEHKFLEKHPEVPSKDVRIKDYAIKKVLHMGLLLREEGIEKLSSGVKYQLEDLSTVPRDDFSTIMDCLAQGIPFVATYFAGKRRNKLKYCQIYKSPPDSRYVQKKAKRRGHAVVLIGGGMKKGRKFFYCVNSWDKKFCPRKNSKGEIIKGGIGKIQASDLTKNVIKLSQPEKTDPSRRLEAQNDFDLSYKNFVLMMALKDHATHLLRRAKEKSEKNVDNLQYDELVKEFREDHLVHEPFYEDEAEYSQNLEDQYNQYSFEEMEDNDMNNEKLCRTKVTKTDDTIQSVHDVAQPVTSGAVAYFIVNQGSNQPDTDGGLGGLQAGRPLYQIHHQQQLNLSPRLTMEMMNKAEEASKELCQEKMPGKPPEEEELVFGDDYEDMQKSLGQARKLSLRKQQEAAGSCPQPVAELATANKGQGDADAAEGNTQDKAVITEMEEFVWGLQLNEETLKPKVEDVFVDEDDDMPSGALVQDGRSGLGTINEETVIEDLKKDVEVEQVILDEVVHEAAVGKGLAGALKFLQERGTLNEGTNWEGTTTDKKKSKLAGIEDGPKEIRIERTDEFGRVMTPKEAFRDPSQKFHGKGPDKMKLEKWQKYQDDLETKEMKSSDMPSMSAEKMREAQARGRTPYLVLSGNAKSGDDNRGGNDTAEELQACSPNSLSSRSGS